MEIIFDMEKQWTKYKECLNVSMLTTAVFELVQQFYHATEIGMPNAASACADQP